MEHLRLPRSFRPWEYISALTSKVFQNTRKERRRRTLNLHSRQGVYQPGKSGIVREFSESGKVGDMPADFQASVRKIGVFFLRETTKNVCSRIHMWRTQPTKWLRNFLILMQLREEPCNEQCVTWCDVFRQILWVFFALFCDVNRLQFLHVSAKSRLTIVLYTGLLLGTCCIAWQSLLFVDCYTDIE